MSIVDQSTPQGTGRAETAVRALEKRSPLALRLAQAVSFAVVVDRALLRAARLELVPEADAGTEADLWFSSGVQSRTSDGIILDRDVAEALRGRMTPAQVEQAWAVTTREHAGLSPSLKIEEEIAYLSVSKRPDARDTLVRRIQSVIRAMLSGSRPGLAQWATRALAMFPSAVRDLPETRMLEAGTRIRLGQGVATAAEELLPEWMSLVAPSGLKKTELQVELRERELVLSGSFEPGAVAGTRIAVPDTSPLVLEVSWEEERRARARQVTLRRGETLCVSVGADRIRLRTLTGEEYVVREVAETSASLAAEVIDFSQEIARHGRVIGRDAELVHLLQQTGAVIITGEYGIGKTALLCELIRRLEPAPVFVHFFREGEPRLESIETARRSLAAQIAIRYRLDDAVVDLPLPQVLERLALSPRKPERLYLVIDDLQDAQVEGYEDHLGPPLSLLLPSIPHFVTVYVSRRDLTSEDLSAEKIQLAAADPTTLVTFAGKITVVPFGEGNFGKAEVQAAIGELTSPFREVAANLWRGAPDFVNLLSIVRGALPNRIAGDVPKSLTPVLHIDDRGVILLNRTLRNAVRGFLTTVREPHLELIRRLRTALDDEAVAEYYTRFAPEHLLEAQANEEAAQLVINLAFMREVTRRHGVLVMLDHLRRVGRVISYVTEVQSVLEGHLDALIAQPDDLDAILALLSPENPYLPPRRLVREHDEHEPRSLPPRRHSGGISGCAQIDQDHVATWSAEGTLMLWTTTDRNAPPQVVRLDAAVTAYVQTSPQFAIAGDALGFLYLVATPGGTVVSKLATHNSAVRGAVFGSWMRPVATWSDDGVIRLAWTDVPGAPLREIGELAGHEDEVTGCAFVNGGESLISSSRDGTIRIWNVAETRTVRVIRNDRPIVAMTVSSDGSWLAAIDEAGRMRIEPVETTATHVRAAVLETQHSAPIRGIARSDDDRFLATWSEDGFVVFWRMPLSGVGAPERGTEFNTKPESSSVAACAFIGYPPRLFVSWTDGSALLLDPEEAPRSLETGGAVMRAVAAFDDKRFYTGDDRGALVEWNPSLRTAVHDYSRAPERIEAVLAGARLLVSDNEGVRFDRTEQRIALPRPRINVRGEWAALWSPSTGAFYGGNPRVGEFHNFTLGTEGLLSVCAVGTWTQPAAAAGHDDGAILGFDVQIKVESPSPPSRVTALAFLEVDTALLTAYASGELTVSRASGTTRIDKVHGRIVAIEVDDPSRVFATVALDGTVQVRSIGEWGLVCTIEGKVDPAVRCRFSLDGESLIGAARDHTIRVSNGKSGEERAIARGHRASITGLAVGDGVIYSSSEDRTVRMWDLNTGEQLAVVYGDNPFRCIDANETTIVAGDDAGEICRFHRPEPALGGVTVFISYAGTASVDRKLAEKLDADLRRWGVRTWFDVSRVSPGDPLRETLQDAVRKSAAMVLIASNHAYSSDWVEFEMKAFQARKDPTIFVLAVDRLERPFAGLPSIDLPNPNDPFAYARAFDELMSRLKERFGHSDVVTA